MGAGVGSARLSLHEMEHGEGRAALLGVSTCGIMPRPSPQAYVNQFKFQSITADDALGFFLEYFPELKEKGVDSIPGQHGAFLRGDWGAALQTSTLRALEPSRVPCRPCACQFVGFTGDAAAATGLGSD